MGASPGSAPAILDLDGGVILGTVPGGEPVKVPFFTETGGTRCALIGDSALPKVFALRALDAGARVQVVTFKPADWFRLRGHAELSAERLAVVGPGAPPPPDGTWAEPWMVIDDTGVAIGDALGSHRGNPGQAFVAASSARAVAVADLRGLDAIILYRSSPACRAAVVAALRLPNCVVPSLHGIPADVVAVVSPGMVRLVPLQPDISECGLFAELGLPIGRSNDCRPVPGLTRAVSFEINGTGMEGEVA